jgi:hypothetical protein
VQCAAPSPIAGRGPVILMPLRGLHEEKVAGALTAPGGASTRRA